MRRRSLMWKRMMESRRKSNEVLEKTNSGK